jgi:antitoxin (DNA-binding transcriptional repressor) of toxin-antitoxin stability system
MVLKILYPNLAKSPNIDSSEVRKRFKEFLHSVMKGGIVVILHYGQQFAALVSAENAARLKLLLSPKYRDVLKKIDAELKK